MMGSHYPGHHQSNNTMAGYNNGATMHISPTPSVRNQLGMQASPALAATAPQHFNGPAICHQAQVGQPQGQQQQAPAMYGTCPAQQQSPVVASGVASAQQGQQQPNMVGCNVMQPSNYSQAANYGPAHASGVNPMPYNNNYNNSGNMPCNNQQPAMTMNNGYMMNQQCGHMQAPQQQANPVAVAQGFNNPCSPCTGHHHQQPQPICNNNPGNNQNWQCGYPNTTAMTQQQQQHHQAAMPFTQQQQHNNVPWQNNAMQSAGNGPSNVQAPPANAQSLMYNNMQSNAAMAYNNYPRPPPYSQVASAIQCQDVSQSQDFINRARVQGAAQQQGPSATPVQQHSQQINNAATAVPSVATGVTTPSNMRPETYQRTLEYVQQCQTWSTTGDSNNGGRAAKENKPPQQQQQQQQQHGACEPQMTKTAETATVGRALLSPGQDAVSSSTDRQEAAAAAAAALLPSSANNMVVNDMNTSLNSLMQENRFLQMIQ
jgi:transcriptional activator cubitus interruptus